MIDFRPMTLRHQVSLILPFGSRSALTRNYAGFRRSDFAPPSFNGFAFIGNPDNLGSVQL